MSAASGRLALAVAVLALGACGDGTPTSPSTPTGYVGVWSGAVTQGGNVSFTVSAEETVVAVTVNYSLNGCTGTATLSNIALLVAEPQTLPSGEVLPPSFGSGTEGLDSPDFLGIQGTFSSGTTAHGLLVFNQYRGCGSALFSWNASRVPGRFIGAHLSPWGTEERGHRGWNTTSRFPQLLPPNVHPISDQEPQWLRVVATCAAALGT
jgi:hypothetical protein